MDPNGIGSTGATALGMGGPSDWENFGPADYEVDDLEFYSTKQEQKAAAKAAEEARNEAPVELPAGSPVQGRAQQIWRNSGAVEIDSGTPVATRPPSFPSQTQTGFGPAPVGAAVDAGIIMTAEPAQMPPTQHASIQQQATQPQSLKQAPEPQSLAAPSGYPPASQAHQIPIASAPLQTQGFAIDTGSGWHPPPHGAPHPQVNQQFASQPQTASWTATQLPQQQTGRPQSFQQQAIPPLSTQASVGQIAQAPQHSVIASSISPRSTGLQDEKFLSLQKKLSQTESELAQFKDREMEHRLHGEQSTEEVQRLKDRIAKLEDECRGAQSECAKLERSVESMENASVTASNQKAEIESERTALLAEKAKWDAERTDLTSKIAVAEAALNKTKAEMEGTRTDLLAKVTAVEAAMATARSDAEATNTGYQTKLKDAEVALAAAKSEIEVAKKQLEDEKVKPVDIAPGLGDWYKGSLARFSETLFAEEAAATVPDKMTKFQDWVNAEAQLRGIEMQFGPKPDTKVAPIAPVPQAAAVDIVGAQRGPSPVRPKLQTTQSDVSIISDDEEYSPGGRPIMRRAVTDKKSVSNISLISQEASPPIPIPQSDKKTSPAFTPFRAYRAGSVPLQPVESSTRSNSVPQITRQAASPVIEPPAAIKPLAYSKPKYVNPVESIPGTLQRSTASAPLLAKQARIGSLKPTDEIFLPDITDNTRVKGPDALITDDALPAPLKPKTPVPVAQSTAQTKATASPNTLSTPPKRTSSLPPFEALQELLPRIAMPLIPFSHPHVKPINTVLSRFSDSDFSFIPTLTAQWEAGAAETRRRLDAERARREAESEEHTSQLFQDGAIGYGDIGEMEGTNKKKELEIQEKETEAEWDSYLKDVFGVIFARLSKEIEELYAVRADVDALCRTAAAGYKALDAAARPDAPERAVSLAEALSLLIRTHTVVTAHETQIQKAIAERDLRYKKNNTRSLYRKGEIKKMKEQELYFDRREKKTEIENRRERLKNCSILMKDVEAAVGRGCNENEDLAKDIIAAIKKVALAEGLASKKTEVQAAVRRANDVLSELSQSSLALMRLFERVASLLNDAEYDHQVAVERASDAAATVFHDLEAEKKEQDKALGQEASQREAGVDKQLQKWQLEVSNITSPMGLENVVADSEEEDKKRRLQAALENAKRRNGDL
jgi:hypothetical protein